MSMCDHPLTWDSHCSSINMVCMRLKGGEQEFTRRTGSHQMCGRRSSSGSSGEDGSGGLRNHRSAPHAAGTDHRAAGFSKRPGNNAWMHTVPCKILATWVKRTKTGLRESASFWENCSALDRKHGPLQTQNIGCFISFRVPVRSNSVNKVCWPFFWCGFAYLINSLGFLFLERATTKAQRIRPSNGCRAPAAIQLLRRQRHGGFNWREAGKCQNRFAFRYKYSKNIKKWTNFSSYFYRILHLNIKMLFSALHTELLCSLTKQTGAV